MTAPLRHGRYWTYSSRGCHCDECREAYRLYKAEYRRRTAHVREANSGRLRQPSVCPTCGLHPFDFTVDEYKRELDRVESALAAARREADTLREALREIRDREPDLSSTDQTAFFWRWAKERAVAALAAVPAGEAKP